MSEATGSVVRLQCMAALLFAAGCAAALPPPVAPTCDAAASRHAFPITLVQKVSNPKLHLSSFVLYVDGKRAAALSPTLAAGTHRFRFEFVYWHEASGHAVAMSAEGSFTLERDAAPWLTVNLTDGPGRSLPESIAISFTVSTTAPSADASPLPKTGRLVASMRPGSVTGRMLRTRDLYGGCVTPAICMSASGLPLWITFLAYSHPDFDGNVADSARGWRWAEGDASGTFCFRKSVYFGIRPY